MTFVGEMTANVKSFWRWVKNMKGSSNIIPQIAYQNRVFDTDKHKAEAFNNYFCWMQPVIARKPWEMVAVDILKVPMSIYIGCTRLLFQVAICPSNS